MSIFNFRQMLIKCIISIIVFLIASLIFLFPALRDTARNYNRKRLAAQAQIAFQIPSPSNNQVEEMELQPFIQQVFSYYDVFTAVTLKGRQMPNYYTMLISDNSADSFPLTQPSLRLKKGYNNTSPFAFVDYAFAKTLSVGVGDNLTIEIGSKILSVPIYGITANCQDYLPIQNDMGGALIIAISPAELSSIAGKTLQYSGAFLCVSDYNKTKDYLQNYKPFGLLRERSVSENEEDYRKYINDFTSISYEAEIRDFTRPDIFLTQVGNTVLASLPLTIIMMVCFILITTVSFSDQNIRYIITTYIKNGEKINSIRKKIRNPILTVVLLTCMVCVFILVFNISKNTMYCPILSYIPIITGTLGVMLVFGIVFANLFAKSIVQKYTG
jgi:hypothetical protein